MDSIEYRRAMGSFATGVTVVSVYDHEDKPWGVTASSFTSVSLDPPLVSVCLDRRGRMHPVMQGADKFAINILAADQGDLALHFAGKAADRSWDQNWDRVDDGGPRLVGCTVRLDCAVHQRFEAGDHEILVGRVIDFDLNDKAPLGYARGKFFSVPLEG